jgi:hypothetical protein
VTGCSGMDAGQGVPEMGLVFSRALPRWADQQRKC